MITKLPYAHDEDNTKKMSRPDNIGPLGQCWCQHDFRTQRARRSPPAAAINLINVVLRVVHVELAGRRDQTLVLDDMFQLARLVIDDDDR